MSVIPDLLKERLKRSNKDLTSQVIWLVCEIWQKNKLNLICSPNCLSLVSSIDHKYVGEIKCIELTIYSPAKSRQRCTGMGDDGRGVGPFLPTLN